MDLFRKKKLVERAKSMAANVLAENYVLEAPVKIIEIARNYGLLVEEVDLGKFGSQVAGFLEPKKEIIYLNKKDSPARKAFTVAHELGHWLMHKNELDEVAVYYRTPLGAPTEDEREKAANAFAAQLLVPRDMLDQFKNESVSTMARIFGVSEELIGYRLRQEFGRKR